MLLTWITGCPAAAADGTVRDSAYFSIMADEWPAARESLEMRLTSPPSLP